MKESDWKIFKQIKEKAIEKFCEIALMEFAEIMDDDKEHVHNRYLLLYKLVQNRDKEMGILFDLLENPQSWNLCWSSTFGLLIPGVSMSQNDQLVQKRADPVSGSDIAYRYRLFETTNIWTFILLDTAAGRAWQVQYSVDDTPAVRVVINERSLLPEGDNPKNGRFTLYPTQNTYNFLLLDRADSRIWQLQWSLESKFRGIMRSIP